MVLLVTGKDHAHSQARDNTPNNIAKRCLPAKPRINANSPPNKAEPRGEIKAMANLEIMYMMRTKS
jgi:hypothetical protein